MGKTRQLSAALPSRTIDPQRLLDIQRPEPCCQSHKQFYQYLIAINSGQECRVDWTISQLLALRPWGLDEEEQLYRYGSLIATSADIPADETQGQIVLDWYQQLINFLARRAGVGRRPNAEIIAAVPPSSPAGPEETWELSDQQQILALKLTTIVAEASAALGLDPVDNRPLVATLALGNKGSNDIELKYLLRPRYDQLIIEIIDNKY